MARMYEERRRDCRSAYVHRAISSIAHPASGARLFPGDAKTRAIVRRIILEVDNYAAKASESLIEQAFYRGEGVEALARAYSLTPERVRSMLCDGMAEVRKQLRPGEWR